jgi:hypothetical protein
VFTDDAFQILLADRVEQIDTTRFEMTGVNDTRLAVHHRTEASSHIYRRSGCHSRRIRYSSQLRAWAVQRRVKGVSIESVARTLEDRSSVNLGLKVLADGVLSLTALVTESENRAEGRTPI